MQNRTKLRASLALACIVALGLGSGSGFAMGGGGGGGHGGGGGGGHGGGGHGGGGHGGGHFGGGSHGMAGRGGYGGYRGGYGGYRGGYGGGYRGGYGGGYRGGYGGYGGYGGWRGGYGYGGWGGGYGWGGWGWGGLGLGLYFASLPLYYSTLWWGGVPYYYANDNFYTYDTNVGQYQTVEPPPEVQSQVDAQEPVGTDLMSYPKNGQTEDQQSKDKYECHHWATTQSGYDPTQGATQGASTTAAAGKRMDYMRAQAACMEGRGYSVK